MSLLFLSADFYSFYLPLDPPIVKLSFGANLDPSNIEEGNDVYFECQIRSNPEVYKVVWLHNVSMPKCQYEYF